MSKKQIIGKIVNDLPSRDLRSRMTDGEWYGWFEECWDKAINYTPCCTELPNKMVIELSDQEMQIVSADELIQMEKEAMPFDGFEGWIVKGKLAVIK